MAALILAQADESVPDDCCGSGVAAMRAGKASNRGRRLAMMSLFGTTTN
jgi:hypothetical protein